MQNNIIRLLIIAISTAVVALIGMQYYWVHSSVELRKEEFRRNVSEAMLSVADYLENHEALSLLQAEEQNRYLFIDENAEEKIMSAGGDTTYNYMMVERFVRDGEEVKVSITEEQDGVEISQITENRKIEIPKFSTGLNNYSNTVASGKRERYGNLSLNKEVQARITNKNAFIGEIVKKLRKVNYTQTLEERVDSALLDSLLHMAFEEKGISISFEYGVFDHQGIFRFGNPYEITNRLESAPYRTRLFVHDLIGNPGFLKVAFPHKGRYIFNSSWFMLISSALVVLAIIYIFFWTVKAIINQKKNSEIKNDFINNMTHELKTPISTISLAVEVLNDPSMSGNTSLLKRYLGMINEENKRLGMLVEEVLQSAVLDRDAFKLKKEHVQIDALVSEVVSKMDMKVKERQGMVELDIDNTARYDFEGDRVHLTNVMYNLLDNALKYSRENPYIEIKVENVVGYIAVRVKDSGIGIPSEHQKKIFEKLYRVPTGNLHDVKGFGLGLNYVKTIVNRHHGNVDVHSVLGKGSTFSVYLPLAKNTNEST